MSLRLEGEETLKYRSVYRTRLEKFNIVSNYQGRTQKAIFTFQFLKPILQTIIHLMQYTVLGIQFWSVKWTTVRYAKIRAFSFIAIKRCNKLQWLGYMKTNHFKMLLNVFSTTYTYSNCIVYRLFYCWKIN